MVLGTLLFLGPQFSFALPPTPQQSAAPSTASTAQQATPAAQTPRNVTAYTLPPDLYKKAKDLSRIHFRLNLLGFVYDLIVLWLILHWRIGAKVPRLGRAILLS